MFKNIGSQKVAVFAWDNAAGSAKTGDAANISAQISIDGAATAATDDVAPTELDSTDAPGIYIFDMTQAETNGDLIVISPVSSTSDIVLRPVIIYTQTVMRGTDSAYTGTPPTATAIVDEWETQSQADPTGFHVNVLEVNGTGQTANDNGADINAIVADTNELQTDDYPTSIAALPTAAEIKTAIEAAGSHLALIKAVTDALTTAAATKIALSAGTIVVGTVSHDNTAATTTVFYCDDITEATADHYNGRIVIFTSGALQYQASDITDYELDTGEGKFTVTATTEAAADNDTFIIV